LKRYLVNFVMTNKERICFIRMMLNFRTHKLNTLDLKTNDLELFENAIKYSEVATLS